MRYLFILIVISISFQSISQSVIIGRNSSPLNGEIVSGKFSFFNKEKGSFSGGQLSSSANWSPDSLGQNSFAWGMNVKSLGEGSISFGDKSEALGLNSVSIGSNALAEGSISFALGSNTYAGGIFAVAMGNSAKAMGAESFALGNVTANGASSFASGINNETNGKAAFVFGQGNFANGENSLAAGVNSNAIGENSSAIGSSLNAASYNEFVIGYNNTLYTPNSSSDWVPADRLFVIGNGISAPSDAMVVLKNGDVSFPDGNILVGAFTLPQNGETTSNSFMMFDKTRSAFRGGELSNSMNWSPNMIGHNSFAWGMNVKSLGEGSISFGDKSEALGLNSVSMGSNTLAVGSISVALGSNTYAGGIFAVAMGNSAKAMGAESFALGNVTANGASSFASGINNETNGKAAFVFGQGNFANGENSLAAGVNSSAIGENSSAIGSSLNAASYNEFVIGYNNTLYTPNSSSGWVPADRLFVIGNGINGPSDAMVVLKNGDTRINGNTEINGDVLFNGDAKISDSTNPELLFERTSSGSFDAKIRVGTTGHMYFEGGADYPSNLAINMTLRSNGRLGIGTTNPSEKLSVVGNINASGTITSNSDRRFKVNLTPVSSALSKINQINAYYYYWDRASFPEKEFSSNRQIGIIAQELEALFPEMVLTDNEGYKSVDYSRLTPVLIEAVKDLTTQNQDLEKEMKILKQQVDKLLSKFDHEKK